MAMIEAATGDREALAKRGGALDGLFANDRLSAGQIVEDALLVALIHDGQAE